MTSTKAREVAVYIMSKATRSFSQVSLADVMGLPLIRSEVRSMAAKRAGIRIGKFRIGSMTSRRRMFTVRALNMVPVIVMPQVASRMTNINSQNCDVQRTL